MNMENIKKLIGDYKAYAQRKAAARSAIDQKLAVEKERLNSEHYERYATDLNAQHDKTYRPEFDQMGAKLNRELDSLRDNIQRDIADSKPENYDLKLSNLLKMIEVLDGKDISNNMPSLMESIKPFSYDPLIRTTIEKKLASKGAWTVGMFDDETPHMLELLETARDFTTAYDDLYIGHNMVDFFSRNFDGIESDGFFDGAITPDNQTSGQFINPFVAASGE